MKKERRKNWKKKAISLILALVMCLSMGSFAFADEIGSQSVYERAKEIEASIPNSEVFVIDGNLHIVVDDLADVPGFGYSIQPNSTSAKVTSVTSSQGGTFRNFDVPWSGTLDFNPYKQVYMSKDVTEAVRIMLNERDIFDKIIEGLSKGMTRAAISTMIKSLFNVTVSSSVIGVISSVLSGVIVNLPKIAFNSAYNRSTTGKVSVVWGIPREGNLEFIYSPWNNNVCKTYMGYTADWYEGEYDI